MNTLLILYPIQFACYTKFSRKVSNIIQNMDSISIVYDDDANGFIRQFCIEKDHRIKLIKKNGWSTEGITHAIVFDDGEEFNQEIKDIKSKKIPFRLIKIAITRVINIKKETQYKKVKSTPDYEYIGRGSYWGNPYSMFDEGEDREEVIRKFKYDFDYEKFPNKEKGEVYKLAGKRLGCFCKPEACHGDVLADFLNSWDDGK